ncbi:carbohydrate esterase family 4 protein [Gonapodya prolifera JEL478]|uniref:Carbohydrate esterase family 4 protein n=1 Tax=Gonapodya prolifera (strain JEL478) TaxID=1344416 RepID=A0A139A364_GONPJ|nr:carbohydrate esterase family 4 protein [Gonapodya prolifera JEL478]|eukprot:KXS11232.1 carbohydrate esterase family 4 protein [Gonapodya prolifera JEL478]
MTDIKTHPRNLVGYGSNPPDPKWPGGAKVAISFVLNYEEGGENTVVNGDKGSEVFLNETPGGASRVGTRDPNMETQYEYGSRAGVWRVANIFAKRNFKFTVYAVGRAVELNPTVITALHNAGHDIASHNHRWIDYAAVPPAEMRAHVKACVEAIKSATGQNPKGWYTGRIGPDSRREVVKALKEMGIKLEWESDTYNDDLPYWSWDFEDITGEPLLILPYTLDANDMKFCVPPGFSSPDGFEQYIKDAIDQLLEEGRDGHPKMLSVGLHCRLAGRPGRAPALGRILDYVKSLGPDVWVATRSEIADHWMKVVPKPTKKA